MQEWPLVKELIQTICTGKIYLTGGAVCRGLAHELHGTPLQKYDWDVIAEHIDASKAGKDWELKTNKFGNPKLVRGACEVDFMPLKNILSIQKRKLEPTIENYMTGTPINIQANAYDLQEQKLIGNAGTKAVQDKTVADNNREALADEAKRKNMTPEELLKKKAESMGFESVQNPSQ